MVQKYGNFSLLYVVKMSLCIRWVGGSKNLKTPLRNIKMAPNQTVIYDVFFPQTASHVKERHKLLEGAIGVFPEEVQAYEKISMLSWVLPLIATIGSLVDTILVMVYMKLAHPWKDILFGQMKEIQPIESQDIQDMQSEIQVRFSLFVEKQENTPLSCQCQFFYFPTNHIWPWLQS